MSVVAARYSESAKVVDGDPSRLVAQGLLQEIPNGDDLVRWGAVLHGLWKWRLHSPKTRWSVGVVRDRLGKK